MLEIQNLSAAVGGKQILKGINLKVNAGEVHAVMGPNGSGKSTLAQVLVGRNSYVVTGGEVLYRGQGPPRALPEDRAREGFSSPSNIRSSSPGVNNTVFLKAACNEVRKHQGRDEIDAVDFLELSREKMKLLELDEAFLKRAVNAGFSGGEKKRNEIFQMAMLEPKLAILDETDSGLDIDALKVVAHGVNSLRRPDNASIVITHYQRLLDYIVPDFVHVLFDGRIVRTGGKELALELEQNGYEGIVASVTA